MLEKARLLERFLRYVRVHTTSDEGSSSCPSTARQLDLARVVVQDLKDAGLKDVSLNSFGYVIAGLPSNCASAAVPAVGLLAHLDTAPDFCGEGVSPWVQENYSGESFSLPDNPGVILDPAELEGLAECRGKTLITASGHTLLGADDKAGVAILVGVAEYLLLHPEIKHGPIRFCFNPDEEIGRGVDKLDLSEFGAQVAYTLDGGRLGELEVESFSADKAEITVSGVSTHPGSAKGKMVNALRLVSELVALLPKEGMSPETTSGREGFIHPYAIDGDAGRITLKCIIRDFELIGLENKGQLVREVCQKIAKAEPRAGVHCEISPQYRNMRYWLEKDPRPLEIAQRAMLNCGINPVTKPIRGGTDGSKLTERGLPTPNIFCGSGDWHGPKEWVCLEHMQQSCQVMLEIIKLWAEPSCGVSSALRTS